MLQAIDEKGAFVTLALLPKNKIDEVRNQQFICPVCRDPVIVKAGRKMIAHFAHQHSLRCPSSDGGEGIEHETGKLLLYEWIKKQKLSVQLEHYLPAIKQRPDLLVSVGKRQIAFEYQCARIAKEEIIQRTIGYLSIGIKPIWILGAKHFHRYGAHSFRMNDFLQYFLHQYTSEYPPTLYFFDARASQLAVITDVYRIRSAKAFGKIDLYNLQKIGILDFFTAEQLNKQVIMNQIVSEKKKFRLQTVHVNDKQEWSFRKWLYHLQEYPQTLPSEIFLPVQANYLIHLPLWNWQAKVFLGIIKPLKVGKSFTLNQVYWLLRQHLFPSEDFPLLVTKEEPVKDYLDMLIRFGVLERNGTGSYMKKKTIESHENIDKALSGDREIVQQLISGKQFI